MRCAVAALVRLSRCVAVSGRKPVVCDAHPIGVQLPHLCAARLVAPLAQVSVGCWFAVASHTHRMRTETVRLCIAPEYVFADPSFENPGFKTMSSKSLLKCVVLVCCSARLLAS